MKSRQLCGVSVPIIGQGTWQMEARWPESVAALRAGIDAGATHIDTAEMYGAGRAESLVGEAIAGRRQELFVVSKVLPHNASRNGTIAACEASLQRLGTDFLDLYLLHWPGRHPLAETFAAFEQLVEQGKIRAWGVSNFDAKELRQAAQLAGPQKIACNQVLYHLGERYIERELLPCCRELGVEIVGYSPLGSGGGFPPRQCVDLLAQVAARHCVTVRQVALAFLVRNEVGGFTIPKAGRAEHAIENAGAGELTLDEEDIAAIDGAFPLGNRRSLPII